MHQADVITSTGKKFWRHRDAMIAYKTGSPNSIVSTHVSPTSACNLRCDYCSVAKRTRGNEIPFETIENYLRTLKEYGLKAVILTGGGEPLLYSEINGLVDMIRNVLCLELGLITNGTACDNLDELLWEQLSWVRVSLNSGSIGNINLPVDSLPDDCLVGCSFIWSGQNRADEMLIAAHAEAERLGAKYLRILPNCMLPRDVLEAEHDRLNEALERVGGELFFHQRKRGRWPWSLRCHQAYFRPYLSEECFHGNGRPGTVYPCDSVVLNDNQARFSERYQICHADDVERWLRREIDFRLMPNYHCESCVFADTVEMLERFVRHNVILFDDVPGKIMHENFV